jgi:hypothetical protein
LRNSHHLDQFAIIKQRSYATIAIAFEADVPCCSSIQIIAVMITITDSDVRL